MHDPQSLVGRPVTFWRTGTYHGYFAGIVRAVRTGKGGTIKALRVQRPGNAPEAKGYSARCKGPTLTVAPREVRFVMWRGRALSLDTFLEN